KQLMLLAEAAQAVGVAGGGATMGRPTCAVLPESLQSGRAATSFGCIGNRVYTGLGDDEGYYAIPGAEVADVVSRLAVIVEAVRALVEFARAPPIHGVVGVDDHTTVVAAVISAALGLPHNPVSAVAAARNKHRMRELLSGQGVPVPRFVLFSVDDDPLIIAEKVAFPCVVKPISLSASCGVIRANNRDEFVAAFRRVAALLEKLGTETVGEGV